MKTKIIYISGSEVFDMADIRAAFDEVRGALGLTDTVLFGVPVDREDALAKSIDKVTTISNVAPVEISPAPQATSEIIDAAPVDISPAHEEEIMDIEPVAEIAAEHTPVAEVVPEIDETAEEVDATPKKSRGRPRKVAPAIVEEDTTPAPITTEDASEHKIIPILSVLAAKEITAPVMDSEQSESEETESAQEENDTIVTESYDEEIIAEEIVADAPVATAEQEINAEEVSIEDMIDDDIPEADEADSEKTLEQLLESMKPLREDHIEQPAQLSDTDASEDIIQINDDADATLAQLATEFAETQDTIVARPQTETHGKIGKLKNILPFKKVKRDDNGLMGDLFGWAGIAANDDDFAIPGFFTTAAKK